MNVSLDILGIIDWIVAKIKAIIADIKAASAK